MTIKIPLPKDFNFGECLIYLGRSAKESLHIVENKTITKALSFDSEIFLIKLKIEDEQLIVKIEKNKTSKSIQSKIVEYISEWFDLNRDLDEFYKLAKKDAILKSLIKKYYGLRIIGVPDIYEASCWSIIGQQINLAFAYELKKRFVENFGESISKNDDKYWLFPKPEVVMKLKKEDLISLQFTNRKAEYLIGVSKKIYNKEILKEELQKLSFEEVQNKLIELKGIGKWSANYVMLRCLRFTEAFPLDDVGFQNALKNNLQMDRKPNKEDIEKISAGWKGWEAYATFYLWRSLYE